MSAPLISIVIPCYNGSNHIGETIGSILSQDEVRFEIIIVDDGSTDDSKTKIDSFLDPRICYLYQNNKGVSAARNNGFVHAKGTYVIFFDADDIMTPHFLSSRVNKLKDNLDLDFISGEVQKFDENGLITGYYRGTSKNVVHEILLYNIEVVTCPSNYCFRKDFLVKNGLLFNEKLSSTADKFFLVHCAKFGKSNFDSGLSKLYYRVAKNSMSHKLTSALVYDNESFYRELIKSDLIPWEIKNKSLFLADFILFASFWKVGEKGKSLKYAMYSLLKNPVEFIKKCVI
ncbi:MAG: glycosyltransferase family 2 protein [Bacteroidetes bacterium]|nr:glycosyltransferase family 2 protein [Bacteroidota bacterium]